MVLASLMEDGAFLRCNERSFERTKRLERVVQEHLSEEKRERVKISCGDGALLCKKESQSYDAILLDAPCSSERHVLNDPKYLAEWSPARVKSLAMQQWALLSSAYSYFKALMASSANATLSRGWTSFISPRPAAKVSTKIAPVSSAACFCTARYCSHGRFIFGRPIIMKVGE